MVNVLLIKLFLYFSYQPFYEVEYMMPHPLESSALGKLTVYNPHVTLAPEEDNGGRIFYVLGEKLMASKHKKSGEGDVPPSPQDLRRRKVETSSGKETGNEESDEIEKVASIRDLKRLQHQSEKVNKKASTPEQIGSISLSSEVSEEDTTTTGDSGAVNQSVKRKFKKVKWEPAQLKGICRSFAQKESNFDVYLTKDRALAVARKATVYDTDDPTRVHAEPPVFKLRATPFKLKGVEDQSVWEIQTLEKVFFLGRSGELDIEYQEIKKYDRTHTNTDDFIFTAENIQDSISKPVKISQDLKAPIILAVLTFVMQIVQTIISAYLPGDDCTTNTGTTWTTLGS